MRVRYSFGSRHTGKIENIKKQRRKYPDVVAEIIKISDIILEVLDARFPMETKNPEIEEDIKKLGKKVIYVLNKCDMVDMKAKKKELKELKLYPYVLVSCRKRIGGSQLREHIKMEAKRVKLPEKGMERVQVGIIGYPNTGKSSLINLLTGKNGARVGAEAGFTKGMQKIKLTSNIMILDTPGVIPSSDYVQSDVNAPSRHAKVNAIDYSKVRNPDLVIGELMKDYSKEIEEFYDIKAEGNPDELIQQYGQRKNLLKKGGIVDEDRASRLILKDWQDGKIRV